MSVLLPDRLRRGDELTLEALPELPGLPRPLGAVVVLLRPYGKAAWLLGCRLNPPLSPAEWDSLP
jgi:hypothetical protein